MTPERWKRVNELFEAALARDPEQRDAFLVEACADDLALRSEVESLLAAHERAGTFIDAPAFNFEDLSTLPTGERTAEAQEGMLSPGRRLGPYEVVALLGAGGMGQVYRARDPRLDREVAIKVLPRSSTPSETRRLEREARAVGALAHPNILVVHDVGVEGDVFYVVSELLEGETLRARLRAAALPVRQCLDYARQIVAGLAAAHEKGIVHRDLKPENLFITRDGRIKILDFGLAKQAGGAEGVGDTRAPTVSLTEPGMVLGTVGYMSPEQVRGRPTDHRSDIFSFGAVLYEMLTGRRAFPGDSQADALSAILRDDPPPASESNPEVPPELDTLGRRCLRKRPEERFQTARELADAIEAVLTAQEGPAARRQRSIAVLPFRDLSGDLDAAHLGLGLADATITELAHVRSLVVRPTSAVIRYQEQPADPQRAGRELDVDAVVEGSFQQAGTRLRVTVRVLDTHEGRSLWADKIDSSLDDIFQMQDEVSRRIARALEVELTPSDERRLAQDQRRRPAREVYELYLKGKRHLLRSTLSDLVAAVDWFEQARQADPGFALAWAGLADAYSRMGFTFQPEGDWYARAQAACEKALSLDPSLPEGRYVRGHLRWSPQAGFDHAGAIRDFSAAIQGRPSLEDAYRCLAGVLYHVGLLEEGQEELGRALALAPDHLVARMNLGHLRYLQGRYAEALEITEDVARRASEPFAFYQTGLCQIRLGRLDEASRSVEVLNRHFPGGVLAHPLVGLIAALRGDAGEALEQVDLTARNEKGFGHYHHAQHDVACVHALLGRRDEALAWLTEAARNGCPCAVFFERDELLASLRDDERFTRLMSELKAECEGYARLYRGLRAASGDESRPAPASSRAGRVLLAVLPFENLSGDPDQEYLSDGFTEELIAQLGRLDPLRLGVIARTSAMTYKHTRKGIDQIGRELGVEFVLEGSVRTTGDRLRIGAQLVQVRDQSQLWTETYDRDLRDVLAVQADLGGSVARQIGLLLAPSGDHTPRAVNPEAYQAYLKGRYFWNKRTDEGSWKGLECFQRALRADPGFAKAHAGMADCYALMGDVSVGTLSPREAFSRARMAVAKALEMDDTLAEAHASLAHLKMHDFAWGEAETEFRRALHLDPNYATAYHWYALFLAAMERKAEAMATMKRALELDPVSLAINTDVGMLLYYARRFDEAIEQYDRTLEMDPSFARAYVTLGSAYAQKGMHDEAMAALEKATALSADSAKRAALGRAYAAGGKRGEALEIVEELSKLAYVPPYPVALIHGLLGNADAAFTWMERAREESAPQLIYLKVDPWLDPLRPDRRFTELLRSVGLQR